MWVRVIQRNSPSYLHAHTHKSRFVMGTSSWLWRLRSPTMHCLQSGNQESHSCHSVQVQWVEVRGASSVSPGAWRPQNQELKYLRAAEGEHPSSAEESRCTLVPLSCSAWVDPQQIEGFLSTLVRRDLLYSMCWFENQSLPEAPSLTHPEIMFGHKIDHDTQWSQKVDQRTRARTWIFFSYAFILHF